MQTAFGRVKRPRLIAWKSGCGAAILPVLLFFLASCSTGPTRPPLDRADLIRRDIALGVGLAQGFEASSSLEKDREIREYLTQIGQELSNASPEFRGAHTDVFVIQDRGPRWQDYSIPGNRIYISTGLLKNLEFETELAGAIGIELAHIVKRHLIQRISQIPALAQKTDMGSLEGLLPPQPGDLPENIDYFGPAGIFAYSEEDQLEVAEEAVNILYRAGYDPRGVTGLWRKFQENPEKSPYELNTLEKLAERSRRTISSYSPLRNPIVRSESFLAMQKRIKKL